MPRQICRIDKYFCNLFCFFFVVLGCKDVSHGGETEKKCIAEYRTHKLYLEDLGELLHGSKNSQDSHQIIGLLVDRWVKDKIFLERAKAELGITKEVEELVQKYREELLTIEYERKILREKLDTTVKQEELTAYYDANKSEYKLENTILRCVFVKINKPVQQKDQFDKWWKNLNTTHLQQLNQYCQNNAEVCFLNPDKWIHWNELSKFIPGRFVSEEALKVGLEREFADFNYQYALKIFEVVKPKQSPPLSYVKDQAIQAILHSRKQKLLENIRNEYLEMELKAKNVRLQLN